MKNTRGTPSRRWQHAPLVAVIWLSPNDLDRSSEVRRRRTGGGSANRSPVARVHDVSVEITTLKLEVRSGEERPPY